MGIQEELLRIRNEVSGAEALKQEADLLNQVRESAERVREVTDEATKSTFNFGDAAFHAVRATADLQRGFRGVPYHIQALTEALGGPVGLGVALSGVAFAAYELYEKWDKVVSFFKGESLPTFDAARTNLENLSAAIKTNKEELEKLKDIQSLNADQQERYNFLTDQALRLTIAKNREDEKARAALEARTAAAGKPEIAPEIKAGMAGMAAPQVEQMIRGVREARGGELAGKRERAARALAARAAYEAKGLEQGGPEDDRTAKEVIEATRDLAASEGRISREAEEAVGLARRGEVPAFQQVQAAARAQPFRFQGLEQFFQVGPTRTPEQEARARKRAVEAQAREEREWQGKFARADREAMRVEKDSERLATQEANRQRRDEISGIDAQNKMDQLGEKNAERARRQREREVHREVGQELGTEAQVERAGMGAAEKWFQQLAHQQARAMGTTVQNQVEILRNNEMVRQQYQMIYENAAMVRRMVLQQNQKTRRDLEERRNQQNNGE